MVWVLAFDRLTVKEKAVVPGGVLLLVPSGLTTSSMESAGWVSSFFFLHLPSALGVVHSFPTRRSSDLVSSGSNAVSAHTSTVTGLLVSPGAKVSVPLGRKYSGLAQLLPAQLVFPIAVTLPVA